MGENALANTFSSTHSTNNLVALEQIHPAKYTPTEEDHLLMFHYCFLCLMQQFETLSMTAFPQIIKILHTLQKIDWI